MGVVPGGGVVGVVTGGGGAVAGSGVVIPGSPLHDVTSLVVCPGKGWRRRDTGAGDIVSNGESGPDRGRLGSVKTALNDPPSEGRLKGPCLDARSPVLHKRGVSWEQRSRFSGVPNTGRESQAMPAMATPSLKSQLNWTAWLTACLFERYRGASGRDRRLLEGVLLGTKVEDGDSGINIISVSDGRTEEEEEGEGAGEGGEVAGKEEVSSRSREEEATDGVVREAKEASGRKEDIGDAEDVRPMGEGEITGETSTVEGETAGGEVTNVGTREEGEGEGEGRAPEEDRDIPGVLVGPSEGDTSVVDSVTEKRAGR